MNICTDALCIKNWEITAENGDHFQAKRGKMYTTTRPKKGEDVVTVLSRYWVEVPIECFSFELTDKGVDMEDRKVTLLRAAYELIKKCNEGPYVKNVLEETVNYDDAECDGWCLATDISYELDLEEPDKW